MQGWKCPVCGGRLENTDRRLVCAAGHSYDLARQGYVNLLPTGGAAGKRHGDDSAMVRARTDFLEKGYYEPIRDALLRAMEKYVPAGSPVVDAGCGEGYYTAAVLRAGYDVCGVDISREAVKACARRGVPCAAASTAHLPLTDGSQRAVLCLFAPLETAEFRRVLAPGGVLLRAVPLQRHLWGLKKAVYARPYENPAPEEAAEGFETPDHEDVKTVLRLTDREDIQNLFRMTPYWYKTSREDEEKLSRLSELETEIEVRIGVFT